MLNAKYAKTPRTPGKQIQIAFPWRSWRLGDLGDCILKKVQKASTTGHTPDRR
jgi:hypothetical protein